MPRLSQVRLTKRHVDQAKPGQFVWDCQIPGFGVRVTPGGKKSFIFQYRTQTLEQGRITIAGYPAFTVEEARVVARKHLAAVEKGLRPQTVKDARRLLNSYVVPD